MMEANASSTLGPSSCALGPHATGTQDAGHLCKASFTSATIYYPTSDGLQQQPLPSIVIVGGWGCGEQAMAAWGPFYASHGIVAMTIGTPAPWKDVSAARCQALLDASASLQSEHGRAGSILQGRLDATQRAVQGYSFGGGGAQLAAQKDPTLKCAIALCPDDSTRSTCASPSETLVFPSDPGSVPVLIICGENDSDASPSVQAWQHYRQTAAPKLIFEVTGGDHYVANGPAGGRAVGDDGLATCCNFCTAFACMVCCPNALWCGPCPCGTLDVPSGHATDHSPRGAIGGVALAWLRLFLLGDEDARSQLVIRPDIASGFDCSGIAK